MKCVMALGAASLVCLGIVVAPVAGQNRAGYAYNPYTGRDAAARTEYNPYTGVAANQERGHNPYTGRDTSERTVYNPYTGRYAQGEVVHNPYTGRTGYAYRYGRR